VDFTAINTLKYPLQPTSVTPTSIIIRDPFTKTVKLSVLTTYSMPQPEKLTISNLLKSFSVPEKLTEDNAWYCNKCKSHKLAKKKLCLYTTPKYLLMHLKRFSHKIHGRYVSNSKIDSSIKLSDFEEINGKRYELISIVNHMGSISSGHYTATVKKNEWLCFDDERVRRDKPSGDYAYLLLYRQVDQN
jgi:ubiquitin C-terminal hydrolase